MKGVPGSAPTYNGAFSALANNSVETQDDPTNVVDTVLSGRGGMPAFGRTYPDEQIAAAISYVRRAFGNSPGPVSPDLVAEVRKSTPVPPLPATPVPSGTPGAIQGLGN